uniref:Uncharacterized protein n=1 Tax=Labeo catla TaxID=72446 RepID=Q9PU87_LABCA|nr:hypothetical protein [Labeo catla]
MLSCRAAQVIKFLIAITDSTIMYLFKGTITKINNK